MASTPAASSSRASSTVVAVERTSAFALDYQRFQRFLLAFPESMYSLLRVTIGRLMEQSNALAAVPSRGNAYDVR